jgi:hypothetical protein
MPRSRSRRSDRLFHHEGIRMNLEAIAQAYVQCVELDDKAQSLHSELAGELSMLRSDLHALLMEALRQAHIAFSNRSEAAGIAIEIVSGKRKTA